jgi:hypothetical protein
MKLCKLTMRMAWTSNRSWQTKQAASDLSRLARRRSLGKRWHTCRQCGQHCG